MNFKKQIDEQMNEYCTNVANFIRDYFAVSGMNPYRFLQETKVVRSATAGAISGSHQLIKLNTIVALSVTSGVPVETVLSYDPSKDYDRLFGKKGG